MTTEEDKVAFMIRLNGKRDRGEIHNWFLRDVPDEDGTILGQIVYGWRGFNTYRTSAVIKIMDFDDYKLLETRNSFYKLVGPKATENEQQILEASAFY